MEWTVHRLDPELLLFELNRREHRIGIVLFMAADIPEIALRYVWREHEAISTLDKLFAQIIFHLLSDRPALRMPQYQSLSVCLLNRKQIELAPEATMIA